MPDGSSGRKVGLTREKTQLLVALLIVGLWALSLVVLAFDGDVMAKVLTPVATTMLGWLFAAHATGG